MRLSSPAIGKIAALALAAAWITGCGMTATPSSAANSLTPPATASGSSSGSTTPSPNPTPTPPPPSPTPTPSPTPPPPIPPPDPQPQPVPDGATVIAQIQSLSGWQTCGGCGNQGGTGQGPDYGLTQAIATPSLSGNSTDFWINGGPAWTGGYYLIYHPTVPNPFSYLRYEFDLYLPSQYVNAPQAIEFECQQTSGGYAYNYAWQADYASNTWRVFNYTTKHWEGTSITLQRFTPDTWHHIIAIYHGAGTQVIHDSLTVDGVTHMVNIAHEALQTGNGLQFTNAFQLDLDKVGTPYKVYIDNMKVSYTD